MGCKAVAAAEGVDIWDGLACPTARSKHPHAAQKYGKKEASREDKRRQEASDVSGEETSANERTHLQRRWPRFTVSRLALVVEYLHEGAQLQGRVMRCVQAHAHMYTRSFSLSHSLSLSVHLSLSHVSFSYAHSLNKCKILKAIDSNTLPVWTKFQGGSTPVCRTRPESPASHTARDPGLRTLHINQQCNRETIPRRVSP